MSPPRLLIAMICLLLCGNTYAEVINVPSDYTLIQDAINASSDGDVINIAAGTYNEYNLNPGGKAITIKGTPNGDGSLATTIDAQQTPFTCTFNTPFHIPYKRPAKTVIASTRPFWSKSGSDLPTFK